MTTDEAFDFLGISPSTHTYKQGHDIYRALAKKLHPDKGGDAESFKVLQNAWEIVKPRYS